MNAAVRVEALKLTRSPVGIVGSAAIVIGTCQWSVEAMLTASISARPMISRKSTYVRQSLF